MTNHTMTDEARELELYIENEEHLYRRTLDVYATLAKHWTRGTYTADRAPKAFSRLVADAAREYQREHGSPFGAGIFTKAHRDELAASMAADFAAIARDNRVWGDLGEKAEAILRGPKK